MTLRQPQPWGHSPGQVEPGWDWFWRPGVNLTAGLFWKAGDLYDYAAHRRPTIISTAGAAPVWRVTPTGQSLRLNGDAHTGGDTIELTHLGSTALDGLTAFTYAVHFTFIGSSSADEDSLGLQWSALQGGVDANASRILVRYDSLNGEVDFFTDTGTTAGLTGAASLADGRPHVVVFRYNSPHAEKSIWLDGARIAQTGAHTGALKSDSHSKLPEVFGGHLVTDSARTDSPRVDAHGWTFHRRAWADAEIVKFSRDPFGPYRLARPRVAGVLGAGASIIPRVMHHRQQQRAA